MLRIFILGLLCLGGWLTMPLQAQETSFLEASAGTVYPMEQIEEKEAEAYFSVHPISEETFQRMKGKSYKTGCRIPLEELRLVRVIHRNFEGKIQRGEVVCNRLIANDLKDIFKELFLAD